MTNNAAENVHFRPVDKTPSAAQRAAHSLYKRQAFLRQTEEDQAIFHVPLRKPAGGPVGDSGQG